MRRVKRRIFSGAICEQVVFNVRDNFRDIKDAKPARQRFKNEEDRVRHKTEISRRRHIRSFQANFSPESLYSTLTFATEYEVHTFEEAHRIANNYCRRLLYACPGATIFLYMGRGKATSRIHFHVVSDGIPEDLITSKWGFGSIVRIEHLRAHNYIDGKDCGQDYSGLANYLFNHWTPEVGGHRWKAVGNIRKPEPEDATECKRNYSAEHPPLPPKGYMLVETKETGYGYLYFRYVVIPPKQKRKRKKSVNDRPD